MPPSSSQPARRTGAGTGVHGLFDPGQTLAGRYRIVSRLGKGGMGEVYRADDLTLGVSVALKFLPAGLAHDPRWLENFRAEVRLAREITHPSVCRVYDITEADGLVFLTMEHVDGEDLASLLRRIGRLPHDKAVQIARQLCSGLAAAHNLGVIHRDLKPANIMIDGRGNTRIMDFGIAGVAGQLAEAHIAAGTPAYMPPEQFAGTGVTTRSDLYSLGLVLFELFTGKTAFEARTIEEIKHVHQTGSAPALPSTIVRDLDPAVERIILRCLEPNPALRPPSAIAVAAALPGGDPLAAALAAGETPSPELVAQSGGEGTLRPATAGILLAIFLVLGAGMIEVRDQLSILKFVKLDTSGEVLAAKGRELIAKLGYPEKPTDTMYGFTLRSALIEEINRTSKAPDRWNRLTDPEQSAISFWYRESPAPIRPTEWWQLQATASDPPDIVAGSTSLTTDTRGRLRFFTRVPPRYPAAQDPAPAPFDPAPIFAAAGLDANTFTPTTPEITPPVGSDTRLAWKGDMPGSPAIPVSVETASERGRLVSYSTIYPWSQKAVSKAWTPGTVDRIMSVLAMSSQVGILVIAAALAWRNVRAGRADRRGAARLAFFVLGLKMLVSLLAASWAGNNIYNMFGLPLVRATYFAALWWVFYLALEPTLRRVWPHALISWSRALDGRLRDARVGRDVLIGAVVGLVLIADAPLAAFAAKILGEAPPWPLTPNMRTLSGARFMLAQTLDGLDDSVTITLLMALGLVILRMIFRNSLVAAIGVGVSIALVIFAEGGAGRGPVSLVSPVLIGAITSFVLLRFGVLAFASCVFVATALMRLPVSLDLSSWYAGTAAIITLALIVLPVVGAARCAIGDQPLFKPGLLDA